MSINHTLFESLFSPLETPSSLDPSEEAPQLLHIIPDTLYLSISNNLQDTAVKDPQYEKGKTRGLSSSSGSNVSWNGMLHLLLLSLISTAGATGSIFIISAITVIDTFQVRGNLYLVSLSLGHLLVTIFVLPASCVAIMAGIPNDPTICHYQWLATLACLLVAVLSFMFMAIENFVGMGSIVNYDLCCTRFRVVFIFFFIWIISLGFALSQHFHDFGPHFCEHKRSSAVWIPYHAAVGGALVIVPTLVTIWYFARAMFKLKRLKLRSQNFAAYMLTDQSLLKSNLMVYTVTCLMWTPLCVLGAVSSFKPITQDMLNMSWYLALSNSCGYSFLYASTNREFGEAFFKLFYYCCFKSHVNFARKGPAPRRALGADPIGLRVHIIPGMNIYAQRKDMGLIDNMGGSSSMGGMGGIGGGGMGTSFGAPRQGMGGFGGMSGNGYGMGTGSGTVMAGPFGRAFHSKGGSRMTSDL